MARKKARGDDQVLEAAIVMLPAVRSSSKHPHEVDPYEAPAGAVPVSTRTEPIREPMTAEDIAKRQLVRNETKVRADRYLRYLDAMAEHGGNQVLALAAVYPDMTIDEIRAQRADLQADVRTGLPSTTLAEIIQANDVGDMAQISMLRKHMYSDIPAASLKAIDMLGERAGKTGDVGSFENYLRVVKARGKSA